MNIKTILGAVGGMIAAFLCDLSEFFPIVICVVFFSGLDFATGLVKGKIKCEISSKKAFEGFWKKMALLMALFLGIFLDFALPALSVGTEFANITSSIAFSGFIGFYIVICEAISIVENLYECCVPLPNFLINFLNICKEKIDDKGDEQ